MANPRKIAGGAAAGTGAMALMLAIATPFVGQHEGLRTKPYLDVVGVKTVCYGETRIAMREYTPEECAEFLRKALEKDFAPAVAKASPGIQSSPYEWAAHTAFAYNIGVAGYRRSSVARLFNAGDRVGACRFMRNYKYAGGRVIKGLIYRREGHAQRIGEYELCLAGAVPETVKS